MKERPILFSAPMVRALLAGTKTQTRRALKQVQIRSAAMPEPEWRSVHTLCPYGQPGDRLWVRERWAPRDGLTLINQQRTEVFYWADDEGKHWSDGPWKPSIHMPRWASRITLELTSVRIERLGDISEVDAIAEGIGTIRVSENDSRWLNYCEPEDRAAAFGDPRHSFWSLWKSINGQASHDANPWVWVLEFRRI